MKLSEAIRLGAMLYPQCRTGFTGLLGASGQQQVCALIAAAIAGGCEIVPCMRFAIDRAGNHGLVSHDMIWPEPWKKFLYRREIGCPACGSVTSMMHVIICLNDTHHWIRERIADWVATVEPQEHDSLSHEPLKGAMA